jgi:hypothetical protein
MRATGAVLRGVILVLGVLAVGAVEPTPLAEAPSADDLQSDAPSCIPAEQCCKRCDKGKACGNSCISRSKNCHKGRGCACDAEEICE